MVTFLGERTGIGREPRVVRRPNSALPLRLDVANVTTADPGVQVENVSARGRRTRYQRVPGSPSARRLGLLVVWGNAGLLVGLLFGLFGRLGLFGSGGRVQRAFDHGLGDLA